VGEHDDTVMSCWMAHIASQMDGRQIEWMDKQAVVGPNQLLAAPVPVQDMPDHLTLQVEQRALASIQEGREVEVGRDPYLARIRQALHDYAGQRVDAGEDERAAWAMAEVSRLDQLHGFRSYRDLDQDVGKRNGSAYRAPWQPVEGAPMPDDTMDPR
jgi:hypothetical protein